jgi:outer membrane lipoprotein SlyB
MDPPVRGKNKVWVEFQDMSAQGGSFEDAIWEGAQDAVERRGYESVAFPEDADYVVWATLRMFDEVEDAETTNKAITGMGAVAGGVAGGVIGHNASGGSHDATTIGALAGGGVGGVVAASLTRTKTFVMVVDLQISSRRDDAIVYKEAVGTEGDLDTTTAGSVSLDGGFGSTESGQTKIDSQSSASFVRESFFAEKEQRLMATAKGTSMNEEEAKDLLIPKIIDGLGGQLPRYRR